MQLTVIDFATTPNPNALKYVVNQTISSQPQSFYSLDDSKGDQLIEKLLILPGIESVFYFDNFITITKSASHAWNYLIDEIKSTIEDTNFTCPLSETQTTNSVALSQFQKLTAPEQLQMINQVFDQHIRPGLALDGGGLQVINLEKNQLTIKYQGACGSCPSSTKGTLQFIEQILKTKISPDLKIILS